LDAPGAGSGPPRRPPARGGSPDALNPIMELDPMDVIIEVDPIIPPRPVTVME